MNFTESKNKIEALQIEINQNNNKVNKCKNKCQDSKKNVERTDRNERTKLHRRRKLKANILYNTKMIQWKRGGFVRKSVPKSLKVCHLLVEKFHKIYCRGKQTVITSLGITSCTNTHSCKIMRYFK